MPVDGTPNEDMLSISVTGILLVLVLLYLSSRFRIFKTITDVVWWDSRYDPRISPSLLLGIALLVLFGDVVSLKSCEVALGFFRASLNPNELEISLLCFGELAVFLAVEIVNPQPNQQPSEEAQPGQNRQARHQQCAEEYAQNGSGDSTGSTEAAMPVGLAIAKNNDSD